jgi:hypothetical protein
VQLVLSDDEDAWDAPLASRLAMGARGAGAAPRAAAAPTASPVQAGDARAGGRAAPARTEPDVDDDCDDFLPRGAAGGAACSYDVDVLSDDDDDDDDVYELPQQQRGAGGRGTLFQANSDDDSDDEPVLATGRGAAGKAAPVRSAPGGAATKAAEKARRAEERREAAARKKADKEAQKASSAAAKQEHRAASGKLAGQQITVFIDSRLASTAVGRVLGAALAAAKFAHSVTQLPVEGSVCWVRHAARSDAWAGALPWPGPAAAAAAARQGGATVPYVLLVMDAPRLTAAVAAHGGLEHLVGEVRAAHPSATLCVCGIGVHQYLRSRERAEFSTANPAAGFSRDGVDAALARLVTHVRGVRQRMAKDVDAAAEHGVLLTDALARQPFRSEESFLALFGGERKGAKPSARPAGEEDGGGGDPDDAAAAPGAARKRTREPSLEEAWVAALARVPSSGADSAAAIARAYPCMAALMAAYRAPGLTDAAAKALLANLARDPVASGAKSRRVGPACSERMWKLFRARPADDAGMEEL